MIWKRKRQKAKIFDPCKKLVKFRQIHQLDVYPKRAGALIDKIRIKIFLNKKRRE